MKGKSKILKLLIIPILLLILIFTYVIATEELSVKSMDNSSYHSAIHYSDDRLLYWSSSEEQIIENVKKYYLTDNDNNDLHYLTNDGVLNYKLLDDETKTKENIKDFYSYVYSDEYIIIYQDNNNNLYVDQKVENIYSENEDEEIIEYNQKLLSSNVSKLHINTNDNLISYISDGKLYAYLINDHASIELIASDDYENVILLKEPLLISENIKDVGDGYYLTNNNELYIKGEKKLDDIQSVEEVHSIDIYIKIYEVINSNNEKKTYIAYNDGKYEYQEYIYSLEFREIKNIGDIRKVVQYYDIIILNEEGNLYQYDYYYDELKQLDENVSSIESNLYDEYNYIYPEDAETLFILYENNNLHTLCLYNTCDIKGLDNLSGKSEYKKNNNEFLMKNIKSIEYINDKYILMENGLVYRFGENTKNEFRNVTLNTSYIPVVIDELINNGAEFKVDQIIFNPEKNVEKDTYIDYAGYHIPTNVQTAETEYVIEDTNIIVAEDYELYGKNLGTTSVCQRLVNDKSISDCANITVMPELTGIWIEQGNSITVEEYEDFKLSIKPLPEENNRKLMIEVKNEPNYIYFDTDFYDYETEKYIYAESNEIFAYVSKQGVYEITLVDATSGYEDTITVNVVEKVSSIEPILPDTNFDGINNAFIYLSDSNELRIDYEIYFDEATNKNIIWSSSDESVATVSQTGVVTAYKKGRTKITMTAADGGGATRTINVIVYENKTNMPGDIMQDGSVDILDVIKLRKYLAGLEEEL